MRGKVDEAGRALLRVVIRNPAESNSEAIEAWIDTGFTGELVLSLELIRSLALEPGPLVTAILADGSQTDVATYNCEIQWFRKWKMVEVVASDSNFPLVGVKLLAGRDLRISYRDGRVILD